MSRRKIKAGSTSVTVPIFVQDTTSTTGGGLGSLVYNTASLAAKYRRQGDSSWTTITLATATLGAFTSGGFVTDGGPVTGGYEVGIPDAALATGAKWCEVVYYGAANMLPVLLEFELDAIDYQGTPDVNAVAINGSTTAATNAAAGWAGLIADTGTAQAGASSTITLRSGAVATDDYYTGSAVAITGGTGAGQVRKITGYVGSTKVATVDAAWVTNPDNTSTYQVLGRIV
jgi:hypothetical protein